MVPTSRGELVACMFSLMEFELILENGRSKCIDNHNIHLVEPNKFDGCDKNVHPLFFNTINESLQ